MKQNQKIFGIGLSRTGTTSLTRALKILGIQAIHFPTDSKTSEELMKGNYRLSILQDYDAILDVTVAPYYAQLDEIFPDSKFILTIRNIDHWLRSVRRHFRKPKRAGALKPFYDFIVASTYGVLTFNESRFRYVYQQHCANVLDYFRDRPKDLLVIDLCAGEGWENLCSFLDCPVPTIPMPVLNQHAPDYTIKLHEALEKIYNAIPSGKDFILIRSKYDMNLRQGWRPIPFFEKEWGYPPNQEAAVFELEAQRKAGANFLVFLWPYFWWFDEYPEFHSYLGHHYLCIVEDEHLVVFDLQKKRNEML